MASFMDGEKTAYRIDLWPSRNVYCRVPSNGTCDGIISHENKQLSV